MIRETTYSSARAHLSSLMDQVTHSREPILIRRRGKEPVALVAAQDLAGWIETAYLLRSPSNVRRLSEAQQQIVDGASKRMSVEQLQQKSATEPE